MAEVAALVMAAGRGTRFGAGADESKVLALLGGRPLVRHVVERALASRATQTFVVTGQAADAVAEALAGLPVTLVHNPAYASGMASSVKAGIAALPAHIDGALVMLADMPRVATATLDALIAAFAAAQSPDAVVPVHLGRQGNPVLLGRASFSEVSRLEGDAGARKLFARPGRTILPCPVDDPASSSTSTRWTRCAIWTADRLPTFADKRLKCQRFDIAATSLAKSGPSFFSTPSPRPKRTKALIVAPASLATWPIAFLP